MTARDEELYLLKDVIDHFIDICRRHSLGILNGFEDVRAKSLEVGS